MIRPMRLARAAARLGVIGACALSLGACISLLPKTKPAQLYRLGQTPQVAAQASAPTGPTVGVFRANGTFQRESAGDRLLTITDDKAAYVAQSRWVSPASVLFDEAVLTAFDADSGRIRLVSRGEPGKADYSLRLDVRNFETRYDHGPKAAPLVVIRLRAALTRADNSMAGEQILESSVRADDNRVGPIVAAYDKALDDVLAKLITWTDASAKPVS